MSFSGSRSSVLTTWAGDALGATADLAASSGTAGGGGSLAEYAAVEARNLAPLPADVDHIVGAALPISGLTAWQGLFGHARLTTGQTVLIHGAAGGVGSIAVQLAREVGALVIGTGRAADREASLGLRVRAFFDLQADRLEDAGEVDVVFDAISGEILDRSTALVRAKRHARHHRRDAPVRPRDARPIFFVAEPDRFQLGPSLSGSGTLNQRATKLTSAPNERPLLHPDSPRT
jgi:NADPH:quinone reductase-like Zn-dependent oxidoreductase